MRTDLLVNDFVLRAVRDRYIVLFEADFKRNYLHIRDAADAFLYCLENFERMKNQPYNVGLSEANLSKRELCEEIKQQVPDFHVTESAIGEDPDKRDYIVSNAKIEAAGFKARRGLQEGIAELIKAFQVLPRHTLRQRMSVATTSPQPHAENNRHGQTVHDHTPDSHPQRDRQA